MKPTIDSRHYPSSHDENSAENMAQEAKNRIEELVTSKKTGNTISNLAEGTFRNFYHHISLQISFDIFILNTAFNCRMHASEL